MCYLIKSDLNVSEDHRKAHLSYDVDSSGASGDKVCFAAIFLFELG